MSAVHDVIVAGAGPSGTIAAHKLASAGMRVTLVDRLRPGPAKIGEVIPGAACRLLGMIGLEDTLSPAAGTVLVRVGGKMSAWGSENPVVEDALTDPYGPGWRLDRAKFDRTLLTKAVQAGAEHREANLIGIERADEGWSCRLDDNACVRGRWLIDATGRNGRLGRLLGARRHLGAPLVGHYHIVIPGRNEDLDRTIVGAMRDGWIYAGSLGRKQWAVGFHTKPLKVSTTKRSPPLQAILSSSPMLSSLFGAFELVETLAPRDARDAWLDPCAGDSWVACGDAALCFDPLAGQGLFNAIRTGTAAAQVIIASMDGASIESYQQELHKVKATYFMRRQAIYRSETRWQNEAFWKAHQERS